MHTFPFILTVYKIFWQGNDMVVMEAIKNQASELGRGYSADHDAQFCNTKDSSYSKSFVKADAHQHFHFMISIQTH